MSNFVTFSAIRGKTTIVYDADAPFGESSGVEVRDGKIISTVSKVETKNDFVKPDRWLLQGPKTFLRIGPETLLRKDSYLHPRPISQHRGLLTDALRSELSRSAFFGPSVEP